jgi:hypothetical protein
MVGSVTQLSRRFRPFPDIAGDLCACLVTVEFADAGVKTGTQRVLVIGGCSERVIEEILLALRTPVSK